MCQLEYIGELSVFAFWSVFAAWPTHLYFNQMSRATTSIIMKGKKTNKTIRIHWQNVSKWRLFFHHHTAQKQQHQIKTTTTTTATKEKNQFPTWFHTHALVCFFFSRVLVIGFMLVCFACARFVACSVFTSIVCKETIFIRHTQSIRMYRIIIGSLVALTTAAAAAADIRASHRYTETVYIVGAMTTMMMMMTNMMMITMICSTARRARHRDFETRFNQEKIPKQKRTLSSN